jgi:hypothetical protein
MSVIAAAQEQEEIRLPQKDGIAVERSTFVKGQLGVIAKRDYKKGEVIFAVEGPVVPKPTKYSFAVGLNQHIEPIRKDGISDFGHYLNHSCDPNVVVRPVNDEGPLHIDVIARRDIRADEELAFDYASLEYDVTVANSPCQCGTDKCRGVMHGFKDMPEDTKEGYKKEGLIAPYLLDIK